MKRSVKKSSERVQKSGAKCKAAKQHKWKENRNNATIPEKKTIPRTFECGTRKSEKVKKRGKETEKKEGLAAHETSDLRRLQ